MQRLGAPQVIQCQLTRGIDEAGDAETPPASIDRRHARVGVDAIVRVERRELWTRASYRLD